MVEITEVGSTRVWLEKQSHQVQVCFAARAALRGLPGLGHAQDATIGDLAFVSVRAILISAVAAEMPAADMKEPALSAHSAAHSAAYSAHSADSAARSAALSAQSAADSAHSTDSAARSAALSARSAAHSAPDSARSAAHSAAYSATSDDASSLDTTSDPSVIFDVSLWPGQNMPVDLTENLQNLRDFWHSNPAVWDFWERWYDGFLNGTPLDWDVQLAVAMLPDDDWKKGPEWIAGKIRGIERDFLAKKAPLAETIEFNPETNKFHAIPLDIARPDLVTATLSQLSDALEDVLADPSNGLNSKSREVRVAQRTLDKYADDPQQIELNLVSIAVGLRRQLFDTFELPETEGNLALLQTAEDGAVAIRATHPRVAENREILAQQKFVELPDDDKAVLEVAMEPLLLLSEWQIADDFAQDIPALINTSVSPSGEYAPPLPGVTRTFGRIARISQEMEQENTLERIKETKAFATAEVLVVGGSFVALMNQLVQMGLRLFGVL